MHSKSKTTMENLKTISEQAKKELAGLSGFTNPAVVGVKKSDTGWTVAIEIVEKKSIPEGMDLLGLYEVDLDAKGGMRGYARKGLRKRVDTQGIGTQE
ncbi:MAG: gas vesicle protein GvpO [Candidatus Spechtbacterales bacterium]